MAQLEWVAAEGAPEDWKDGRQLLAWHPDRLFPGFLIVIWSEVFGRWITEERVDLAVSHIAAVTPPEDGLSG